MARILSGVILVAMMATAGVKGEAEKEGERAEN